MMDLHIICAEQKHATAELQYINYKQAVTC